MELNSNFSKMTYKEICEYLLAIKDTVNVYPSIYRSTINILLKDNRKMVQKLGSKMSRMLDLREKEIMRVRKMYDFDKSFGNYKYIAGVDEVGRGPLAGPIVAAAVVLDLESDEDKDLILRANDSKKLSIACRKEFIIYYQRKSFGL